MPERTAAEVLAGKLEAVLFETRDRSGRESYGCVLHVRRAAARLAEDPAITVRTDMVVERFVVEFHDLQSGLTLRTPEQVYSVLTSRETQYHDEPGHRIIVR